MSYKKLAKPKTVGELTAILELYPDDSKFNFRNQPAQTLYESFEDGEYILFFQLNEIKVK